MRPSAVLLAVPLALAVCAAGTASAQEKGPSSDVRGFRPPTDPAGSLYLEPPLVPGHGAFNFGAWVSDGWRPAVVRTGSGNVETNLLAYQTSADLTANVGLTSRAALG